MVIDDQRLFLTDCSFDGGYDPVSIMIEITKEGEVMWEKASAPGFEMGALILVNGLIINQNGKNGDIYLIEPSPDGYIELGKASFFNSKKSQAWSPLAFSQGLLIVRDMEKMVCIDLQ